jgi:hypothetical protein
MADMWRRQRARGQRKLIIGTIQAEPHDTTA